MKTIIKLSLWLVALAAVMPGQVNTTPCTTTSLVKLSSRETRNRPCQLTTSPVLLFNQAVFATSLILANNSNQQVTCTFVDVATNSAVWPTVAIPANSIQITALLDAWWPNGFQASCTADNAVTMSFRGRF